MSIGGVFVSGFLNYGLIHGAYGLAARGISRLDNGDLHHDVVDGTPLVAFLHLRPRYRYFVARAAAMAVDGRVVRHRLAGRHYLRRGIDALSRDGDDGRVARRGAAYHQIALNVASVAFMVPLTIGQAANVRVDHWIGAGVPVARHAGFVALALGVGFMMCSGSCRSSRRMPSPGFLYASR